MRARRRAPVVAPAPSRPAAREANPSLATAYGTGQGVNRGIGQRLIIDPSKAGGPGGMQQPAATPASPPHPAEPISEEFLARVLEADGAHGHALANAGGAFDPHAIQRQLDALPDRPIGPPVSKPAAKGGMMALGAGR